MKIKVLIPKWNLLGYQLLVKILIQQECKWYILEEDNEHINIIVYTDSEYIRKHIYRNCYYERLVEYNEEKEE